MVLSIQNLSDLVVGVRDWPFQGQLATITSWLDDYVALTQEHPAAELCADFGFA